MKRALMAAAGMVAVVALVSVGVMAQTPAKAGQQKAGTACACPMFVDANGDGICDHFAASGGQRGRGMGPGAGAGFGRGMRGGFGAGLAFGPNGLSLVDLTAQVAGRDRAAVVADLQAGKTPAQIAEAAGKSATDLVEAAVAARRNALASAVAAGTLTHEQADQLLAQMRTHVEQQVTAEWQPRGRGRGMGRGMGWGRGWQK